MTRFDWTPSRIARMREVAADGGSGRDLIDEWGCSRGSFYGTAARHQIKFSSATSNAARKGTAAKPRVKKRKTRPPVTLLEQFAEMLAEGFDVGVAGKAVYGYVGSGKLMLARLQRDLGWQAQ